MRLSVIFFEGSWVTLSSWVWFWHDFPEGVRSLEKQNLQFILANAFSSSELKKVYGIDGVPRNLVGVLLEQRGTKLCQRFSFLFLLLCFCFFVFVLFSVFDHLFIKCKYFSIGSGGAQVYFKKIDLISRKCWQLFEDWIFVTETVQLLFTRGHVWYPILSTEKCPSVFFLLWIQDFSKENWWKSEAKAGLEHPTLFLNPYAYGTQGYKGCYFFLACFSQFFSVVVFLFVHRDAKDGFLFFLFFLSLFLLIFFLHAFCSKLD